MSAAIQSLNTAPEAADDNVMLKLLNVESAYGPIKAIRGVSLQVRQGEIATVLGSNGAGKTTILKTSSGIIDPRKGSIEFKGQSITAQDPAIIVQRGLMHVPEGREVFPLLSIRDNLLMGAYPRKDRDGVARDMEAVYNYFPILRERAAQDAGLLSGGQQQMLAISRALMANPDLILLDEPSLGLSHVPEGREVFALLSVYDNLLMGAYTRQDRDAVAADMALVYSYFPILRERATQDAGLLSGGQQQMLAISRALMTNPDLMLLDEPSLGLSPKLTKEIFEIVLRINRERGTTILLVEQNANMALNASDYGYVLENGRIVMEDSCARLREKDDIKEFYLGLKEDGMRGERRWKKKKTWR